MSKRKSNLKSLILNAFICVFVVIGFCMVFTNLLVTTGDLSISGTSIVKGTNEISGLGVIFGGSQLITTTVELFGKVSVSTLNYDFAFNIVGMLAFILPLVGAVLIVLNKFFTKKTPILSIVGTLLLAVGFVLLFFISMSFKAVNPDFKDVDFTNGAGLTITIVAFGLATLLSCLKLFFLDFKK